MDYRSDQTPSPLEYTNWWRHLCKHIEDEQSNALPQDALGDMRGGVCIES